MSCIRFVIPRFAQYIARSAALTTTIVPRNIVNHSLIRKFSTTVPKPKRETVTVYFIDRDGDRIAAKAAVGSSFLEVAIDNDVELEERNLYDDPYSMQAKENNCILVAVHFVCQDGTKHTANARVGDNLLDVVIDNDIDIDGFGACEGTLACSTCHLIFEQADFDKLPQEPTDEELDMLDLAYGLVDTSRLGCQIIVTKDMEGLTVRVPAGVADAREP